MPLPSTAGPIADCDLSDVQVYDFRTGESLPISDVSPVVDRGFNPHFGWLNLRQYSDDREGARPQTT